MATKELMTRIQLKYDSYDNWTSENLGDNNGANLVLLPGEIGICTIPTGSDEATTNPTVLFKVGDGVTPFKTLKWASALAADVHSWAKATNVVVDGKTIKFVGAKNPDGTDKVLTFNFATPEEVKEITDDLASRIADLEGMFGDNGDVSGAIADHESRLAAIEGDGTAENPGAIKAGDAATLAAAQTYADGLASNYDAAGAASGAETAAKAYAKELNDAMAERVTDVETDVADHETRIGNNTTAIGENATAISNEVAAREAAIGVASTADKAATGIHAVIETGDKAINDKIGTSADVAGTATVYGAIATAKKAGDDAAAAVDALSRGQVATNTSDIADLAQDLADAVNARTEITNDHEDRLVAIEAFFEGAASDEGEGENLKNALDTLKEIQEFATGEGTAAQEMLDAISENAQAIEALQDIVKDGGTLEGRVDDLESRASSVEGRAKTLEDIVAGYSAEDTVKKAVDAVSARAEKGITDAAAAQSAAEAAASAASVADGKAVQAQKEVDELETVVAGVKITADTAASDLAALVADTGRIKTAENAIAALELVVNDTSKGNDKLRTDVNALQTLAGDAAKGNEALYTELNRVAGLVDDGTTGLAATKTIADEAKADAEDAQARVAAIENDYVKASDLVGDFYIFNCGSATKVTHEAPAAE